MFGTVVIWIALCINAVSGMAFVVLAWGRTWPTGLARWSYHCFAALVGLAVAFLLYLFLSHDYSVSYVYQYSQASQGLLYVISALWAGQEGSYLLWLAFAAAGGYWIIRFGDQYKYSAMAFYTLANLFLLVMLVKLSPFELLPTPAADGLGMNPLLQDPWMVIHPPVMFVGYALAGIPFSLSLSALVRNDYSRWPIIVYPWVAICSLALAAGNILGGFWAYETLGWGGFWAWDPVENSSLVPWLISLSLLHGLAIQRRTGALCRTNLVLALLLFLLVIYGTFLTRSGVLADFSVHSFVDLGQNALLVGFLSFYTVVAVGSLAWRVKSTPFVPLRLHYFNREFMLFGATVLLLGLGVIVVFWSSLPILSAVFDSPRAAQPGTYNSYALPFAVVMAVLLTVNQLISGNNLRPPRISWKALLVAAALATVSVVLWRTWFSAGWGSSVLAVVVLMIMLLYLFATRHVVSLLPTLLMSTMATAIAAFNGVSDLSYLVLIWAAAMAGMSSLIVFVQSLRSNWWLTGGDLVHLGFAILLIGVLASSAFASTERLSVSEGKVVAVDQFDLSIAYEGVTDSLRHPENQVILKVDRAGERSEIRPRLFFSDRIGGLMRRPSIERTLLYDLYFAPQQLEESENSNQLRISKGETQSIGNTEITFVGFQMESHGDPNIPQLRVSTELRIEQDGEFAVAKPIVINVMDSTGSPKLVSHPVEVDVGDLRLGISVHQILADQSAVVLDLTGLTQEAAPGWLLLDVIKKPLINLVWLGCALVVIGSLVAAIRRQREVAHFRKLLSKECVSEQPARFDQTGQKKSAV